MLIYFDHVDLTPHSVFLTRNAGETSPNIVKLGRYWYFSRIHDLHTANRFGSPKLVSPQTLPDGWLPREVLQSRYQYSKRRDIWYLGVVVLQMIGGLNVVTDWSEPFNALHNRM